MLKKKVIVFQMVRLGCVMWCVKVFSGNGAKVTELCSVASRSSVAFASGATYGKLERWWIVLKMEKIHHDSRTLCALEASMWRRLLATTVTGWGAPQYLIMWYYACNLFNNELWYTICKNNFGISQINQQLLQTTNKQIIAYCSTLYYIKKWLKNGMGYITI